MKRVLLLEDDSISVMLITSLLQEAGFDIDCAETTDGALTLINRQVPDILLSDWSVDGSITAGDLARLLRSKNPQADIIFITGHSPEEIEPKLFGLDPFGLYRKPVEYEAIIEKLRH